MNKIFVFVCANIVLSQFCLAKEKAVSDPFDAYLKNDAYIASIGRGETAAVSEQNALEGISKYFSMQISVKSTERTVSDGDGTRSVLTDESFVKSETELFAVHYEKPRYDKKQKLYETVAYIDRKEAWEIYDKQIEKTINTFENLFMSANSESEPLKKAVLLSSAKIYAEKSEIERKINFATILYPDAALTLSNVSKSLSMLPTLVSSSFAKSTVAIRCDFDDDGIIKSAVISTLQKFKIPVSENNNAANYLCTIHIEKNVQTLQAGTFYAPSYTVTFLSDEKSIMSCAGNVKKIGAKSIDVANSRAVKAIAKDVSENIGKILIGKN